MNRCKTISFACLLVFGMVSHVSGMDAKRIKRSDLSSLEFLDKVLADAKTLYDVWYKHEKCRKDQQTGRVQFPFVGIKNPPQEDQDILKDYSDVPVSGYKFTYANYLKKYEKEASELGCYGRMLNGDWLYVLFRESSKPTPNTIRFVESLELNLSRDLLVALGQVQRVSSDDNLAHDLAEKISEKSKKPQDKKSMLMMIREVIKEEVEKHNKNYYYDTPSLELYSRVYSAINPSVAYRIGISADRLLLHMGY